MSEPEGIKIERDPTGLDILAEEARRFFENSSHAEYQCSVCQGATWEFPQVCLQDGSTYIGRSAFTLTGSRHALPVLVLVCDNCGNTRQVATHIIQEWLANNQPSRD